MTKRKNIMEFVTKVINKFSKFSKHQRMFVSYLVILAAILIFLPIIKYSPNNSVVNDSWYKVWLLWWNFFKTMIIILVSMVALLGWNVSFKFKNFIINYFWFKENDALVNFGLLWIVATSFISIWDTINTVNDVTQTISKTSSYYFIQIFILIGLVLTVISVVKHAKESSGKTKIVNIVNDDAVKDMQNKRSLKWLFEGDE